MGSTSDNHVVDEKLMALNLTKKICGKRDHVEDPSVDGRHTKTNINMV